MGGSIWMVIAAAAAALLILWMISAYNGLLKRRQKVKEAFLSVELFLKKRYDLLPSLAEPVMSCAPNGAETLQNVLSARAKAATSGDTGQKMENERKFSSELARLMETVENNPRLRADVRFTRMADQLSYLENEIATSRRYYNAVAGDFNAAIAAFPSVLIARLGGFGPELFFDAPEGETAKDYSKK